MNSEQIDHGRTINGISIDLVDNTCGGLELHLHPSNRNQDCIPRRKTIKDRPECRALNPRITRPDCMVQIKCTKDAVDGGFITGTTMQNSSTAMGMRPVPTVEEDTNGLGPNVTTTTFINTDSGLRVTHHIESTPVEGTLRIWTTARNISSEPITIDHLSSFTLSGITPFAEDDAAGRLRMHRFRSWWSNEGYHENRTLEEHHLIRNWGGCNFASERFGQIGTMPVRQFFPFIAIEDTEAKVLWGAQLAWAGSWQMECSRRGDTVSISGGLADDEFGHWKKTVAPGEQFISPKAHVACVTGSLQDLTAKLVQLQEALLPTPPKVEADLPIIFNEWCTNWGSPSHDKTLALAQRLQGSGVTYIVIDDGWAIRPAGERMQSNGDWEVDTEKFPHGMQVTSQALRKMGFIPGIWFEFEACNPGSKAFERTEHLLQRYGAPLRVGARRFWNLNDPWVVDYFDEKIIQFLKDNEFGYLKIDYNDSIGMGCDHPDSLGEGLRHQVEGIYQTFQRIKNKVGDLVIENCSSGGHRLEPSMMNLTSMSSFSDAHESTNIPIIARQLQHLVPPRQSQIWAVLYPEDSPERFVYSLSATFYGRMCLSGPVHDLSDEQMATLHRATQLYKNVAHIIRSGFTHFIGTTPGNWRDPAGWSGVCRIHSENEEALVVIHTFENTEALSIPLPIKRSWSIMEQLHDDTSTPAKWEDGKLHIPSSNTFRGHVIYFST